MRQNVKIVGIGRRLAGTSKTGKAYDFLPVSFLYKDDFTTGYKAVTCNINGPIVDSAGPLAVNKDYDVVFHFMNNSCFVDAILGLVEGR